MSVVLYCIVVLKTRLQRLLFLVLEFETQLFLILIFFLQIISNLNFSFDYKTSEPLSDYCIIEILQELSTK